MKKYLSFFCLFLILGFLNACHQKIKLKPKSESIYSIQGAFFGGEEGQELLFSNANGSVQYRTKLNEYTDYEFKIKKREVKDGPFVIIYAYGEKPELTQKPPFIKANLPANFDHDLYLPAILTFNWDLRAFKDTSEKDKIFFSWDKPPFSRSEGAKVQLLTYLEEKAPFKGIKRININKFDFEKTNGFADLKAKMQNKKALLKDRLKDYCHETNWYLLMNYNYPEGLPVTYSSNQVLIDVCP